MINNIFGDHWILLTLATLAITFNMYTITARSGRAPIGSAFKKYQPIIELLNWLLLLAVIGYLSYSYTWWFVASFFVFPVLGTVAAWLLKSATQLVYLFGMPIAVIAAIWHVL